MVERQSDDPTKPRSSNFFVRTETGIAFIGNLFVWCSGSQQRVLDGADDDLEPKKWKS